MRHNQTNCVVAFIDILGFRDLVKKNKTEKIEAYFSVSETVRNFWSTKHFKQHIKVVTVSDSIVVSLEIEEKSIKDRTKKLTEFFIAISILQGELALHDIWTRGGVSIGKHFADTSKNVVFGPAMIDAYDLESKVAKYPRILIDLKLVDYLNCESTNDFISKINNSLSSDEKWRNSLLYPWISGRDEINTFKKDYPLFIDYLAQFLPQSKNSAIPEEIKSIIGHLVSSSKENPQSYEKLRWVGDYLNMRLLKGTDPILEDLAESSEDHDYLEILATF